jgi:hypothetical protein
MVVRLSALRAYRALLSSTPPPRRIPVLIYFRGWVHTWAVVRMEWLGELNKFISLIGLEPSTFRLVAYYLNLLR